MKKKVLELIKNLAFNISNGLQRIEYLICCCFKTDNNKVFVNCFDGVGVGDNPKYIVNSLLKKYSGAKVVWLAANPDEFNDVGIIPVKRYTFLGIKIFSFRAIYEMATAKIWISTVRMPLFAAKRKNQFYVQTWHGCIALKRIEKDCEEALSSRYLTTAKHDSKMIDVMISNSSFCTNMYKNTFWYDGDVAEIGCPRNDLFFHQNKSHFEEIKSALNIPLNKKVLLYAPTFRKNNSMQKYNIDYERLKYNLEKALGGEWVIALRLHPRLKNCVDEKLFNNTYMINASSYSDSQELLMIADAVISDYSSIMFDYLPSKRPVFIYACDIDEYKNDRNFYFNLFSLPYSVSQDNNELENNILNFSSSDYLKAVDRFSNDIGLMDDGLASERVAELIIKNMR
jgi:CDP-glycerol glycerophosphotransferase